MASDLPVELLEDIFLRLDDAADLARTSAACASFRRVVSDSGFLRRFRSLHRRPVLGLVLDDRHHETGLFRPGQSPPPRRQAAGGFAKAADFTFSFLPDRSRWRVCDARDGRILLARSPADRHMFKDLVIYDPLHRRHVHIPAIPGDLLLSADAPELHHANNEPMSFDDPFLAPSVADKNADEVRDDDEGFRVMCTALSKTKVVAFVFSSGTGQWRRAASFSSTRFVWNNLPSQWSRQYVHSCVCWAHEAKNAMLVFDTRDMKFSLAGLPRKSNGKFKMAVEARDARLGLLTVSNRRFSATLDLYSCKAWQGIQEPEEWHWQHDGSIPVRGFHLKLVGEAESYVLLRGIPAKQFKLWTGTAGQKKPPEAHYFTLEIKRLLVEKLCVLEFNSRVSFLYASFPPPFSPTSV